jgi:hypothetical protein
MCLTLNEKSEIKTAKEDIVCYKVARKDIDWRSRKDVDWCFVSPFRGMIYKFGELYSTSIGHPRKIGSIKIINEGFHSFTCKEDAYKCNAEFEAKTFCSTNMVVVKCIIPKGATYIEGMFVEYPNYVSNKIICLGEV